MTCVCGHTRGQHTLVLRICKAPAAFASLTGASPLGGRVCFCVGYTPPSPRPRWLARILRRAGQ